MGERAGILREGIREKGGIRKEREGDMREDGEEEEEKSLRREYGKRRGVGGKSCAKAESRKERRDKTREWGEMREG